MHVSDETPPYDTLRSPSSYIPCHFLGLHSLSRNESRFNPCIYACITNACKPMKINWGLIKRDGRVLKQRQVAASWSQVHVDPATVLVDNNRHDTWHCIFFFFFPRQASNSCIWPLVSCQQWTALHATCAAGRSVLLDFVIHEVLTHQCRREITERLGFSRSRKIHYTCGPSGANQQPLVDWATS